MHGTPEMPAPPAPFHWNRRTMSFMTDDQASLLERFEALQSELASVRAQLDEMRAGRDRMMRLGGRCRACGCESIVHAKYVADQGGDTGRLAVKFGEQG